MKILDYVIIDLIAVASQEEKKREETKKYLRIAYEARIKTEHNMVQYQKLKNSQNSALKSPPYEGNQKLNFNTRGNNPLFFLIDKDISPTFLILSN